MQKTEDTAKDFNFGKPTVKNDNPPTFLDAIIFFLNNRGMKSKSECSCEPNMRELCMHCDHEKKHKGREQRIMYDRIPA